MERHGRPGELAAMANMRLREFRENAKLTLEGLAHDVGLSVSQLSRIERGERRPRADDVQKIATRLGVPVASLFPGAPARLVPLVGYVGAGSEAHYYAEGQGTGEYVPAPEGSTESTVAVEIRGESLGSFFDHWLVFYDDVKSPVTPDLIGKLCVVALIDDRILIKKIQRSRAEGFFHLLSQTEDPILDAEVVWAARVKTMVPK